MDDYYSPDATRLANEPIEVVFKQPVFMLGAARRGAAGGGGARVQGQKYSQREDDDSVGPSSQAATTCTDAVAGTKLVIPFCVAVELHNRGVVSINTPSYFSAQSLADFKADATLPSIPERSPAMLEHGAALAPFLPPDESQRVREVVMHLFVRRISMIATAARAKGHDLHATQEKLGEWEQRRFRTALADANAARRWRALDVR